ncbi:uncharacterized protein EI90DRAFT_3018168 [Cantharellus anzutake]|uniref:uncharacterized protein n=1 Tax=Cantharellus anzutake TaxID=1750568 RepID=UPI001905F0C6|nr:uncharacterized protein EI90DRAFT_3018168 [Cantharellus anzutake]KAF8327429.1 hypothetical protein EI90DRAFT_3018168 [Cantharellus anzutake]
MTPGRDFQRTDDCNKPGQSAKKLLVKSRPDLPPAGPTLRQVDLTLPPAGPTFQPVHATLHQPLFRIFGRRLTPVVGPGWLIVAGNRCPKLPPGDDRVELELALAWALEPGSGGCGALGCVPPSRKGEQGMRLCRRKELVVAVVECSQTIYGGRKVRSPTVNSVDPIRLFAKSVAENSPQIGPKRCCSMTREIQANTNKWPDRWNAVASPAQGPENVIRTMLYAEAMLAFEIAEVL